MLFDFFFLFSFYLEKKEKKQHLIHQCQTFHGPCVNADCSDKHFSHRKNDTRGKIILDCKHVLHSKCAGQIFTNSRRVPLSVLRCPVCTQNCSFRILKDCHWTKFIDNATENTETALKFKNEVLDPMITASDNLLEYSQLFNDYRKTKNYAKLFH